MHKTTLHLCLHHLSFADFSSLFCSLNILFLVSSAFFHLVFILSDIVRGSGTHPSSLVSANLSLPVFSSSSHACKFLRETLEDS